MRLTPGGKRLGLLFFYPSGIFRVWVLYEILNLNQTIQKPEQIDCVLNANFKVNAENKKPGTGFRAIAPDARRPGYVTAMNPQPQRG